MSIAGDFIDKVFLGNLRMVDTTIKNAGVPGVGLDVNDGIPKGQLLYDETNDDGYICTDNAAGAAVWVKITAAP